MGAGQARPVYKTLANHVVGRATLANVECLLKETPGVLQGLAMGRADAVAPMMALAQSLNLLFVEFHVHLVLPQERGCARSMYSTPWRVGWSS